MRVYLKYYITIHIHFNSKFGFQEYVFRAHQGQNGVHQGTHEGQNDAVLC